METGLSTILGTPDFWAHALQSLKQVEKPAPPKVRRVSTRAAEVDPLGIQVLGIGPVIRPKPGVGCDYQAVGSIAELREYVRPILEQRIPFGSDWETTSLNSSIADLVGWGVSREPKSARYAPVGHMLNPGDNLPVAEVLKVYQELDAVGAESIFYNASYDMEVMWRSGKWEPTHWHDAQIGVFLVDSNVIELNLKTTALRILGAKMQSIEELDEEWVTLSKKAKKERHAKLPHELPIEKVAPYGCDDAGRTREIYFHPDVQRAIREQPIIYQIEEWLVPVMREGNRYGVYIDTARLKELQVEVKERLAQLEPEIFTLLDSPTPFKLSQRKVLGDRLFEMQAVGYIEKNPKSPMVGQWTVDRTDKGDVATGKKVLDKYRKQHPVIPKLIEYAELEAQERNYIKKLLRSAEHFAGQPWANGRVRFAFNGIGVPTGRMKCGGAGKAGQAFAKGVADVNVQSLPDHEKAPYLPNTRSAIVAPPGYVVLAGDYSQIEVRLPANLAKEPVWIDAFNTGKDIHTTNAQLITNIREPGVIVTDDDKSRRGHAKSTTFACLYGGDEHTIARNAGVPVEEAKAIYDAYFAGLTRLSAWITGMQNGARNQKQVATFLGRIRRLDRYFLPEPANRSKFNPLWRQWKKLDAAGCREAINHPIQGGAADIFKLACIRLQRYIRAQGWGYDIISPQVLWVHDEVVFFVRKEWVTRVVPVLKEAMEFPIKDWAVPLKTEWEVGSSVLYAEKKRAKALKDGKTDDAAYWDRMAARPEVSNYGELVDLATWVKRYVSDAAAA